jgi:Zinc knuckle
VVDEQKLARLLELKEQRDTIEDEINDILGGERAAAPAEKAKRKCTNCGQPGHRSDACRNKPDTRPVATAVPLGGNPAGNGAAPDLG